MNYVQYLFTVRTDYLPGYVPTYCTVRCGTYLFEGGRGVYFNSFKTSAAIDGDQKALDQYIYQHLLYIYTRDSPRICAHLLLPEKGIFP